MINDYVKIYYSRLYERTQKMMENDYEMAKRISSWKRRMIRAWDNIEIIDIKLFEKNTETLDTGTEYSGEVILDLNEINPKYVGVELVITENMKELVNIYRFNMVSSNAGKTVFQSKVLNDIPGTFSYGIRVFPLHEFLPHRQDFALVKWA